MKASEPGTNFSIPSRLTMASCPLYQPPSDVNCMPIIPFSSTVNAFESKLMLVGGVEIRSGSGIEVLFGSRLVAVSKLLVVEISVGEVLLDSDFSVVDTVAGDVLLDSDLSAADAVAGDVGSGSGFSVVDAVAGDVRSSSGFSAADAVAGDVRSGSDLSVVDVVADKVLFAPE